MRRGVVFLDADGCDAKGAFDALTNDQDVRNRFDYWIDGGRLDKYFHGWNDPKYRECFCFKWREGKVRCRLYGFLCNPKSGDPRFQLCVLARYDTKTQEETDHSILDHINRLRLDDDVKRSIQNYIAGGGNGTK